MYACGLLGESTRKSVEPVAAHLSPNPERVEATHAQLLHFLARSPWEDAPVRRFAVQYALAEMQAHAAVERWIIDDTGLLEKGDKSPGVQRQYTGSAGKVTSCQVGVSLSLATAHAHLPVDFRLCIPESWTEDRVRCREAKIPDELELEPKWRLALDMIEIAATAKLPRGVIVADADYGSQASFRDGVDALGLRYVVGIQPAALVRLVRRKKGRRRCGPEQSVEELALGSRARTGWAGHRVIFSPGSLRSRWPAGGDTQLTCNSSTK